MGTTKSQEAVGSIHTGTIWGDHGELNRESNRGDGLESSDHGIRGTDTFQTLE